MTIPVALIGYGFAGSTFHAPLIRAVPQLELKAIVTSRSTPSLRDVLSNPDIGLVVVATPSATHFEIARAALEAGKHVVVDKPFTLTTHETDQLISLAQGAGRMLSVFHNRRWDGDYLTVRRCIEQGCLGRIYHYEAHYDRFRPQLRNAWRESPGPGSGILYDLGVHLIDQALQLFGLPRGLHADLIAQRDGAETIDYFHLVLDYGRMRAVLHGSMLVAGPGPHFAVHGDRGSFLKYGMDPQEDALKAGKTPDDPQWGIDPPERYGELTMADGSHRRIETIRGSYETYYPSIARCLQTGDPPPVDPGEARNAIQLIETALRESHYQNKLIADR
jgi:scyllo-inositol 2-dehydrogenase (NADP+)